MSRPSLCRCALASLLLSAPACAPPALSTAPNPNSVLSDLVSFTVAGALRARVVTGESDKTLTTPYSALDGNGSGQIAVLGLSPSTAYTHTVEAITSSGTIATVPLHATTAALPADLAGLKFTITPGTGAPQPGYLLVGGAGNAAFAVDAIGTIRFYRDFGEASQETKMHRDGTFTSYAGTSDGFEPNATGSFWRYSPDGTLIDKYQAFTPDDSEPGSPEVLTDPHELLITTDAAGNDHLHLFGYLQRPVSAGNPTLASWHELLRQAPDGGVEMRWKSWTRFSAADQTEPLPGQAIGVGDIDHTNALQIDPADGNYVVSFRHFDALVKVDYKTGAVLWQLGGKQSTFTIVGDPLTAFYGQHSVRVLANGNLLLYDNGLQHDPPESRAVEYQLDTKAMTATMVWQFRHDPAIFTNVVGSVERMQNGNTLVAFAYAGIVDEVDPAGNVVWEGALTKNGAVQPAYRIRRLPSLYNYQAP